VVTVTASTLEERAEARARAGSAERVTAGGALPGPRGLIPDRIGPPGEPDRFALVRPLGGGSMGVVYEAHDRETDRRVALKTLARGEPRYLANLKREFRLVQSVHHPNLVRLHGLFQGAGTWFFTMELVLGRGYLQWVEGDASAAPGEPASGSTTVPSLPPAAAAPAGPAVAGALDRLQRTLPQLGGALVALHAEHLVHRDVKPSNVLVTSEGRLVLIDFGLTRTAADEPHGWTLAGTPAYMAPEQAGGGPVTPAADCYAAGVMLYQALTGRLPFMGAFQDLIEQKRTWSPIPPGRLVPGVPAELELLCMRLLSPDPAARPTAAEIAAWSRGSSAPASPRVCAPPDAVFVGRERELAQICAAFDEAPGVEPAVVLVGGEPGIGKTELLCEAARRFAGERALVLRGRCFEREVTSYAGVDMIVDALARQLRGLDERAAYFAPRQVAALCQIFPALSEIPAFVEAEVRSPAGGSPELRLRAAFHELFARVATRYRLLISIDDAQWLTEGSLLLLGALLAGDDPVPLVLLLAARGPDHAPLAARLGPLGRRVTQLPLGPLSPAESLVLLRRLTGRSHAELEPMAHEGAGSPSLLRELALAIGERAGPGPPPADGAERPGRAARPARASRPRSGLRRDRAEGPARGRRRGRNLPVY